MHTYMYQYQMLYSLFAQIYKYLSSNDGEFGVLEIVSVCKTIWKNTAAVFFGQTGEAASGCMLDLTFANFEGCFCKYFLSFWRMELISTICLNSTVNSLSASMSFATFLADPSAVLCLPVLLAVQLFLLKGF